MRYEETHPIVFKTKELEAYVSDSGEKKAFKAITFYQKIILSSKIYSQILFLHQALDR